jgi:hypothetical protein
MLSNLRSYWFASWWFHGRALGGRRKSKHPRGKTIAGVGIEGSTMSEVDSYSTITQRVGPAGKRIEVPT